MEEGRQNVMGCRNTEDWSGINFFFSLDKWATELTFAAWCLAPDDLFPSQLCLGLVQGLFFPTRFLGRTTALPQEILRSWHLLFVSVADPETFQKWGEGRGSELETWRN